MSHADSIESVGTIGHLQCGGTVEMREVIPRHMFLKQLSSSTKADNSPESVPCGSRRDSALSRNRIISLEDRNGRKGVRSSGCSIPAPKTWESRARKWIREAGNWSQRISLRLSPKRSLTRSWWSTERAMEVFPIPPAPMRAKGSRSSAKATISSISSLRPKQALGGGNSPRGTLHKRKTVGFRHPQTLT